MRGGSPLMTKVTSARTAGFMEQITELVYNIVNSIPNIVIQNDGDYIDDDGLLRCGKCGERKEKNINIRGVQKKVSCLCRCGVENRKREMEEAARKDAESAAKRMRGASLMERRFYESTFDNAVITSENMKNMSICKKYADSFQKMEEKNQGLILWGDVGTGKSYAAACIANSLLDKGIGLS